MDNVELDPPVVAAPNRTGLVLDVAAVGLVNPLAIGEEPIRPYIQCTDARVFLLPTALHDWAIDVIAQHHACLSAGETPMFPRQIEFGVLDGGLYAELL
ncbi:hypothetical protein ABZV58_28310 [Nocardia sp. NPDC004654]|uniref:hypothetical protein n=1 Tax=Nocardia sp. NPDC004654 TaxID=3154776 RepID=UPI0033B629FF